VTKLVQVRVAVVVSEKGEWSAHGHSADKADESMGTALDCLGPEGPQERRFWLTAHLPVPEAETVKATVEEAAE